MRAKSFFLAIVVTALSHFVLGADGSASSRTSSQESSSTSRQAQTKTMKIRMTVNGKPVQATLADNATARDFAALLPLNLVLEDYANTEKIFYFPKKLSTAAAPDGIEPVMGDITYYAPWGNLAIFYRGFRYSPGLIRLGRIESGIEAFGVSGSLNVTIEALEQP